jgi:hypothetical protein
MQVFGKFCFGLLIEWVSLCQDWHLCIGYLCTLQVRIYRCSNRINHKFDLKKVKKAEAAIVES